MHTYEPIPCAQHERLEYAVLRQIRLDIRWLDAQNRLHCENAQPLDVFTRDGAEWLLWRNARGETVCTRLDRLLAFEEGAKTASFAD